MKIGIDLDGVVIDSETTFRTYEELYEISILKQNKLVNRIEKLSTNNIKTLYFRDTNLKKLKENKFVKEVNNWGDICRYISENTKNEEI